MRAARRAAGAEAAANAEFFAASCRSAKTSSVFTARAVLPLRAVLGGTGRR